MAPPSEAAEIVIDMQVTVIIRLLHQKGLVPIGEVIEMLQEGAVNLVVNQQKESVQAELSACLAALGRQAADLGPFQAAISSR